MRKYVIGASLMLLCSPAGAKVHWAAYEGADAVQQGRGGTRVTKHGIDYWTAGAPPRRYQILGVLTDKRQDKLLSGDAVGSSAVAEKTIEVGGNAVILNDSSEKFQGFNAAAGYYGTIRGRAVNKITTNLTVVRYLD